MLILRLISTDLRNFKNFVNLNSLIIIDLKKLCTLCRYVLNFIGDLKMKNPPQTQGLRRIFFIHAIKNGVSIKRGSEQMHGSLLPYGELLLSV